MHLHSAPKKAAAAAAAAVSTRPAHTSGTRSNLTLSNPAVVSFR
jgi:hypothetical protein